MLNICWEFEGIVEFNNIFKKEGFFMIFVSGIVWVSNKFIWSFFFGLVVVIVILGILVFYILFVGGLIIIR